MKAIRFLMLPAVLPFVLVSCDCDEPCEDAFFEPMYLNESGVDVTMVWSCSTEEHSGPIDGEENQFSFTIRPNDTANSERIWDFPFLHKDPGLFWCYGEGQTVRIVFDGEPRRCLLFGDEYPQENDIMSFSSYKNIGSWSGGTRSSVCIPDGMLYRITEEMRASAKPCE